MSFSEFERARYNKLFEEFKTKHGPAPEIRAKLDWGCTIEGQSIVLYEIRPRWDDPSERLNSPFAKTTFVRSTGEWRVYWMRASGKWNGYPPHPSVPSLEEFFRIVREDAQGCFLG